MINHVREQISVITTNVNKRRSEETKLETEKGAIEEKKQRIQVLDKKLELKKMKLREKKDELAKHKKFNEFLEAVVQDKSNGENKEFEDIQGLQDRFQNLKNENRKLMARVSYFQKSTHV